MTEFIFSIGNTFGNACQSEASLMQLNDLMWFQTYLAYFQLVFTIVDKMGKKDYASSTTSNEFCLIQGLAKCCDSP